MSIYSAEATVCQPSPCLNGGVCVVANPYTCVCLPGFTGPLCEASSPDCQNGATTIVSDVYSITAGISVASLICYV